MPLSQTGSYSTHIMESHIDANILNIVLLTHIYQNHILAISMPTY
ncbi:hypothetical protein F383_29424 [Gossypium arboreum]|uniref:Uncharacterized protein n=1 Tax=Gossypium arboreum TaxID=29729 RepID=A0A0B0NBG8_GOSAR|nr:hypothetical protein F383_18104 [Gossypium arboreum]KHG23392.1 hypothetical protein F383_29424 [Gossypium arboreum]